MPLLDWQAPTGTSVVSHRFWIYWAVTVPLTAAVLLLWSTWYLWSDHQRPQYHLAHEEGSRGGRSDRKAFEMNVFKALGLDRMRRKSGNIIGSDAE